MDVPPLAHVVRLTFKSRTGIWRSGGALPLYAAKDQRRGALTSATAASAARAKGWVRSVRRRADRRPRSPVSGGSAHSGLGDIIQSFFLSPKEPVGGWILGGGPVFLWPTATDSMLGAGKWGAGPTIVALQQSKGFTYGILANHIWSYAGWGDQNVNATFLQPFLSYTTKKFTTFGVNTESTYDWNNHQWTVPLNATVSQLLKVGKQPISVSFGVKYYAERPEGGPDWGLRFGVTLLFPK